MRFIDVNDGVIWKALELIREYQLLPRDAIHAATAFIAGTETVFSEDKDFDNIPGLKRNWRFWLEKNKPNSSRLITHFSHIH